MCNRCDSTTQVTDLTEDLVVDGEMVGCVKILCYLETLLVERILLQQYRIILFRLSCIHLLFFVKKDNSIKLHVHQAVPLLVP